MSYTQRLTRVGWLPIIHLGVYVIFINVKKV